MKLSSSFCPSTRAFTCSCYCEHTPDTPFTARRSRLTLDLFFSVNLPQASQHPCLTIYLCPSFSISFESVVSKVHTSFHSTRRPIPHGRTSPLLSTSFFLSRRQATAPPLFSVTRVSRLFALVLSIPPIPDPRWRLHSFCPGYFLSLFFDQISSLDAHLVLSLPTLGPSIFPPYFFIFTPCLVFCVERFPCSFTVLVSLVQLSSSFFFFMFRR